MERFARVGLKVVIERNLSFAYQLYLSVFIFRPDPQRIQYADGRLVIEHILPIVGEFFMNMAQPRRNTIDLQTDASPALNQSKTGISFMASVQFPTNPKKKKLSCQNSHLRYILDMIHRWSPSHYSSEIPTN